MTGPSPRGFLGLMGPMGPRAAAAQWGRSAARVQRVQRVLPACSGRVQRVVVSPFRAMSFIISLRGIKTIQPGCARGKCTPSAYGTSPGGGGLLSASLSANLSHSLLSAAKTSPSGGSTAAGGDRGAFPTPAGRLYGLSAADRRHLYGARSVPTFIYHSPALPTDQYLSSFPLLTTLTEILR